MRKLKCENLARIAFAALAFLMLALPWEAFAQAGGGGMGEGGMGGGGKRPPKGGPVRGSPRGPPPGAERGMPQPPGGEFDPSRFTCFEYTSGTGENATNRLRSMVARVWMEGNLAGLHRARGDLSLSDDAADRDALSEHLKSTCQTYPTASVLTIGVLDLGKATFKLPNEIIAGLKLNDYTCGAHLAAKSGSAGDAVKSDIADMWAFAFIQGYKLVKTPDLIIPVHNKPLLVGAVAKACAANKSAGFLDLTVQVAEKVKLK